MVATVSVSAPFPYFTDLDGSALEDGYIWIGQSGLDPQVNPVSVYWDAAQTAIAAQPIRTRAGYPSNNGTAARLCVNTDYSIRVQNKNGSLIYSSINDNLFFNGGEVIASNATGNGTQTVFPISLKPKAIYINGVYQNQNTWIHANGNVTFSQAPPATSSIEFLT